MKKFNIFYLILFSLFSCTGTEESSDSLLNVFMVDAPADIDALWVELLGVEVYVSASEEGESSEPIFFPYQAGNKMVDIKQLIAGQEVLIGRGEVRTGSLTKLKLRLGDENYLIKDARRINLDLTESAREGLEVDFLFNLRPGISHDVYIDFDLLKSVKAPNDPLDSYELLPSLSAFSKANTGEISGAILPAREDAFLYAIQQNDTTTTGVNIRGTGQFLFRGLEGTYTIFVIPKNEDYIADTILSVIVQPQTVTQLGNITLRERD
ncbi:DUF4382 domain-containing protein [Belliella sp. R4-6]|uniref:DUF4382 domain-containing protein n=1 Tax=Belliella alkalica TaxID=1730871 RepID=A0ABS9VH20_9BACT|nr:DUF4382 domain-containing protein [Belliella alkalica]